MKAKFKFIIALLFVCQTSIGQILHVHTHINNRDKKTRQKLTELIGTITARNITLGKTNSMLKKALDNHRNQLKKHYTKNKYDKKDNFLATSATSGALSLATSTLSRYTVLPYMTRPKREYLQALSKDKAVLLALQYIDVKKVKSGKRQEIYRLRSDLIREFSKNDRDARKILFFSALGLVVVNYAAFSEISKTMKAVEVVM